MAKRAAEATPPSTAGRKDSMLRHTNQNYQCMSPSPWANAPPTPQDSQGSACHSPMSTPVEVHADRDHDDEDSILIHSDGSAAQAASLRRSQPTLITIGRKTGRDVRMQQWLCEIPSPMTPQERYIQGLNPTTDHPLHPAPLQPTPCRQARYFNSAEIMADDDDLSQECGKLVLEGSEKENAGVRNRSHTIGSSDSAGPKVLQANRKRLVPEYHGHELASRKRTKLLDPVRRFSQRLSSSLALSSGSEGSRSSRHSEDLSPEDMARQNEQLYQFSRLNKMSTNNVRMSLPRRYYGSLRSQGSSTVKRMMSSRTAPHPMPPPPRDGAIGTWVAGRPDMIVNVAFIGDARVGKTALIKRLVHGTFPQTYIPSDIQEQTIRLTVDGARVQLNLSEGGSGRGPQEPSILALSWFSVVVLCFDIGRDSTLRNLQKYRNDIAIHEENSVVVLAGLKKDARRRLPPLQLSFMEDQVQVASEVGIEAARTMRCANYFECSALSSCEGVDDLFDYVVNSGVSLQKVRNKTMSRFRFERSVDEGMTKIAEGVRSLFTFPGSA